MKYGVFVALSADGFQANKKKRCDIWMIPGLLFNLSSNLRCRCRNLPLISYVPGPDPPKNMQSFLIPSIQEVWTAHENNVEMMFYDDQKQRVRIHAILAGDQ